MTIITKYAIIIFTIITLSIVTPGLSEAFATKTYATYWFDATSDYFGVSAKYKVDDRDRTGWPMQLGSKLQI
ncbi:MAG: hypothetical protein OXC46_12205 [Thaumarchaeota archaeon]|nr:hypothetical protein [Nitrososphaerota archaeon]